MSFCIICHQDHTSPPISGMYWCETFNCPSHCKYCLLQINKNVCLYCTLQIENNHKEQHVAVDLI